MLTAESDEFTSPTDCTLKMNFPQSSNSTCLFSRKVTPGVKPNGRGHANVKTKTL